MKILHKIAGVMAAVAMITAGTANAQANDDDVEYYDSYGAQGLSPAIGLGVVALAGVVAVAVNNSDRGNSSSSSPSTNIPITFHGHLFP